MKVDHFLCVDCFDHLEQITCSELVIYYCDNPKCRRFGVLTLGGLEDSRCEKRILEALRGKPHLP
ncbi:MAG: hypothetical protein GX423_01665 [Nitrospiraceae bacterium]|nr:hypothetical protein [Nitrospiraceae bacterium]